MMMSPVGESPHVACVLTAGRELPLFIILVLICESNPARLKTQRLKTQTYLFDHYLHFLKLHIINNYINSLFIRSRRLPLRPHSEIIPYYFNYFVYSYLNVTF